MKKLVYLFYALAFVALFSCEESYTIPEDVVWEIFEEKTHHKGLNKNVRVRLNKKVDNETLENLAKIIRKDRNGHERLFIFYYVESHPEGSAWATSHFDPDLKVRIIGSTLEEDNRIIGSSEIEGDLIGKWKSEKSLSGGMIIIYKSPENELMERILYKDGSVVDENINESNLNGVKKYENPSDTHGEYYILEKNGNLGMYGKDGKLDEAVRVE